MNTVFNYAPQTRRTGGLAWMVFFFSWPGYGHLTPVVTTNFQLIGKHGQVPGAPLGFTNGP